MKIKDRMKGSKSVLANPAKNLNKILDRGIIRSFINKLKERFEVEGENIQEISE